MRCALDSKWIHVNLTNQIEYVFDTHGGIHVNRLYNIVCKCLLCGCTANDITNYHRLRETDYASVGGARRRHTVVVVVYVKFCNSAEDLGNRRQVSCKI